MFTIRAAAPNDIPCLERLIAARALVVGVSEQCGGGRGEFGGPSVECGQIRVAETAEQVCGAYGLHVRNAGPRSVGEVIFLASESSARACGLDGMLIRDAALQAAEQGLAGVQLVVTPPLDVIFRRLGARPVCIEAPCWSVPSPRLRLEISVDAAGAGAGR